MTTGCPGDTEHGSSSLQSLLQKAERLKALHSREASQLTDAELQEVASLRRDVQQGITKHREALKELCDSLEKALERGRAYLASLDPAHAGEPAFGVLSALSSAPRAEAHEKLRSALQGWLEPAQPAPSDEEARPPPPEAEPSSNVPSGEGPQEREPQSPVRVVASGPPVRKEQLVQPEPPSQEAPKPEATEPSVDEAKEPGRAPSSSEVIIPTPKVIEKPATKAVATQPPPVIGEAKKGAARKQPALLARAQKCLVSWEGSWSDLPKANLLSTWIHREHPAEAKAFPPPELLEIAYYAFQPSPNDPMTKRPDLSPLWDATRDTERAELAAARWQVAASLFLLHSEVTALEVLEADHWSREPQFEAWHRMVDAVHAYSRQTSEPVSEAVHHLQLRDKLPDAQPEREAAQKVLLALTKPGRFNFLKGQRLSSYMDRELTWLREALAKDVPTEAAANWSTNFKAERQLDQWAKEIDPRPVRIVGAVRLAIIRDLQALQKHTARWVRLRSGAVDVDSGKRDEIRSPIAKLVQAISQEGDAWRRSWDERRQEWPLLVGWSCLLLERLSDAIRPASAAGK